MRHRVLCIEDDSTIQALVVGSLKDFQVTVVSSLEEARKELSLTEMDAILIDIELPDGDGLKFLALLSQDPKFKNIPIVVLSGHSEISNKLLAFSIGAEDFIPKPFDPLELNARVSAKVRKKNQERVERRVRQVGDIEIDFDRQKAFTVKNGREGELPLTALELKILSLLTRRMEQVYSREQILQEVWGETFVSDRTVDSHIAHLRQKLGHTRLSLETVLRCGYRASLN